MIFESIVISLGIILCLGASGYLIYSGSRLAGTLLIIAFLLHAQGAIYINFIGHPEGTGACWATVQDYYSCLPLTAKISMHLSQASSFFLAAGIFLMAKDKLRLANGS